MKKKELKGAACGFQTAVLSLVLSSAMAETGVISSDTHIDPNEIELNAWQNVEGDMSDAMGFVVDVHGVIINGVREPYKSYGHSLDDFNNPVLIGENPYENLRPWSLTWSADMSHLYGLSRTDDRYLISVDPSTGVSTQLSLLTGHDPNMSLHGIELDENDRCFVVSTDNNNHDTVSTLYECDLATGELSVIGTQSIAPDIHHIAATCDGELYGIDALSKSLVRLDKEDGSAELVGPLGLGNGVFLTSLSYDRNNGVLYQYVLANTGHHTALAAIDIQTGMADYVSTDFSFGYYVGAIRSTCENDLIFLGNFES